MIFFFVYYDFDIYSTLLFKYFMSKIHFKVMIIHLSFFSKIYNITHHYFCILTSQTYYGIEFFKIYYYNKKFTKTHMKIVCKMSYTFI